MPARKRDAKGRFTKGTKSKTHPGRLDFTTKKGSKFFDRGGHRRRHAQGSHIDRHPFEVDRVRPAGADRYRNRGPYVEEFIKRRRR